LDFHVRSFGPSGAIHLRKSLFLRAGGVTARENPIFACGAYVTRTQKQKIEKKISEKNRKP
jgi:hypothetical protein